MPHRFSICFILYNENWLEKVGKKFVWLVCAGLNRILGSLVSELKCLVIFYHSMIY